MLLNDPVVITDLDVLKQVGCQMKVFAREDDQQDNYNTLLLDCLSPEQVKELINYQGSRAIVLDQHLLSICLTRDGHHGFQWHLSICEVIDGGRMKLPLTELNEKICNALFSTSKPINNPGKIKEIVHFVGND